MATWTNPTLTSTYSNFVSELQARADSQAKMFDDGVSWTSLPTNTIRWNSTNSRFEKWNGSAWANLSTALTDVCKTTNNLSDLGNTTTARANLGLGSLALVNSPCPVANGGTGATDASGARSNLGLGTIATQAASAVTITGGTLSGITGITMTTGSILAMSSGGTISGVTSITHAGGDLTLSTTGGDYWIYLKTNNTTRFIIRPAGLIPGAHNSYDLGTSGATIKDIYADRIFTGKFDFASDFWFRISGTTYWTMGSASKEFRPNTNNEQELGTSSFYWLAAYCTTLYADRIQNKSGSTAYINYGASVGNIQIYATDSVDIYAGGSIKWYFGSDGKLNPWAAAPDYSITYGWSIDRSLSSNSNLAELSDVVSTIIADLVTLGIFS